MGMVAHAFSLSMWEAGGSLREASLVIDLVSKWGGGREAQTKLLIEVNGGLYQGRLSPT